MAKKVAIPLELKYNYLKGMVTTLFKGFMYAIREKYGAASVIEIYEMFNKKYDRIKNMTNDIKDVFKLEGNDAETWAQWWKVFFEITEQEYTIPERSKTFAKLKITTCPWTTKPKDLSDWCLLIYFNTIAKTINPKATLERPKGMCAGDPHCEYIFKLEE